MANPWIALALRTRRGAAIAFACVFVVGMPAKAENAAMRGVALVIGQSAYEHISPLTNPENDAKSVDRLLSDLGFEVDLVSDADGRKLARSLSRFVEDAEGADVALIYYSGHGIEAGGENFLVPIDADLGALDNAGEQLQPISEVFADLQALVPVTIMLLDACRSNPFPAGSTIRISPEAEPTPVSASGLGVPRGAVALASADAAKDGFGALLGFAAAPGQPALDGEPGGNSPYAAALLKHLSAGGFAFSDVMTMVTEEVWLRTDARQLPWTNTSLRRLLYFGETIEDDGTDDGLIRGERRKLLLTMASLGNTEKRQVANTAKETGVPMDALFAMLRAVGADTPKDPDQLARLLNDQAARLKDLLAERDTLKNSDPEIAKLSELANTAVKEGALTAAIAFHQRAKDRVAALESTLDQTEADLRARRIEHAAVFAASAETYGLAYDHLHAAEDFARAYEQVEKWDDELALRYKLFEAEALSDLGFYRADNTATDRAIAAYETAAALAPENLNPERWAKAQSGLAMSIWGRGQRQSGIEEIDRAATILRNAIGSPALKDDADTRAQLEGDLALVLMSLGEREPGSARLDEAAAAARAAMAIRTREKSPLEWARLQNHLGSILFFHGQREGVRDKLDEAVTAFRSALEVWSPQRSPMDWANAQNNLALTLGELGSRDPDSVRLNEAVKLLDEIFTVRTREFAPLHWAETHSNRGATLYHIGLRDGGGTASFEQAIASFNLASEEITRDRDPLKWAGIQDNIGLAYSTLSERTGKTEMLDMAIGAYRLALLERKQERVPLDWAATQNNLGNAMYRYGELTHDAEKFREATAIYQAVLEVRTRERNAIGWASTNNNLANAYFSLGEHAREPDMLRLAATHYRLALDVYDRDRNPTGFADTNYNIAMVLLELGKQTSDRAVLAEAQQALNASRDIYHAAGQRQYDTFFNNIEMGIQLADLEAIVAEKQKELEKKAGKVSP